MRPGRLALAVSLTVAFATGCAATPDPTSDGIPPPLRHFVGQGVSFDHPGAWREGHFEMTSSFSGLIVYLSTSPLIDPCDRGPGSVACIREAVRALDVDGVLVDWSWNGFPGWTFDPTKGRRVAVGGRAATLEDLVPDDRCRGIGGERLVLVTIDDPRADANWTSVRACLRGPDLAALEAQVGAMLGSVVWH
jgi:hypothetical protein